jgi:hypothetical protein
LARKRRKSLVEGAEEGLSELRRQVAAELRVGSGRRRWTGPANRGPMVRKMLEIAERHLRRERG